MSKKSQQLSYNTSLILKNAVNTYWSCWNINHCQFYVLNTATVILVL